MDRQLKQYRIIALPLLFLSIAAWYVMNPLPQHASGCGNPGMAHLVVALPFVAMQILNLCVLYTSHSADPGVHLVFAAGSGAAGILLAGGMWVWISSFLG